MNMNPSTHQATEVGRAGLLQSRPVLSIALVEIVLLIVAALLALIFGLHPWRGMDIALWPVFVSILAAAPLVAGMLWLDRVDWQWMQRLREIIRNGLLSVLRGTGPGGIVLIALLAGVGEEMLFRGVVQAGLQQWLGTGLALAAASLLFGLMHYVTRAYFILATLIGLYLGLLYLWTGNLLVPIVVHALYDWVALRYLLWRYPAADGPDP